MIPRMAKKEPDKLSDQVRRAIDDCGLTRYQIAKAARIDDAKSVKAYRENLKP